MLDFPSVRTAPAEIVRALKDIDPTAELVWLRRGVWCLGLVKQDNRARGRAEKMMDKTLAAVEYVVNHTRLAGPQFRAVTRAKIGEKLAMLRLQRQGFMHQQTFPKLRDAELGVIVRWFREAIWVRENAYESTLREYEELLENDPVSKAKEAEMLDRARLRDAWRWGFRHPKSITSAGIPNHPSSRTRYDSNGISIKSPEAN